MRKTESYELRMRYCKVHICNPRNKIGYGLTWRYLIRPVDRGTSVTKRNIGCFRVVGKQLEKRFTIWSITKHETASYVCKEETYHKCLHNQRVGLDHYRFVIFIFVSISPNPKTLKNVKCHSPSKIKRISTGIDRQCRAGPYRNNAFLTNV